MVDIRPGVFLEDNPPVRSQFRATRREPVRSVVVAHSAESGTDMAGPDPKAEAVAGFIQRRTDPGSYHLLGDTDSIIQMVRFRGEAYGDRTGSNRWAIHVAGAMNAADWARLTPNRRDAMVETYATMFALAGHWLHKHGPGAPMARQLTKAQSNRADASGFISHAARDPRRRSDPGRLFPWTRVLARYEILVNQLIGDDMPPDNPTPRDEWEAVQAAVRAIGCDPGPIDGIPGPKTVAGLICAVAKAGGGALTREGEIAAVRRKADLWDRHAAALSESEALAAIALRQEADRAALAAAVREAAQR